MDRIVIPGELLAERPIRSENTLVEGNMTYATVLSLFDEAKGVLIPLESVWYPKHGETVIGIIEETRLNSYNVDLNSSFKGMILSKFSETRFAQGDIVEAVVRDIDETKTVMLMHARSLYGGKIIDIKPSKIPRIIGRENTMLNQLMQGTMSSIKVGTNGRVWIKGGDASLATEAILRIQEEAHTAGLTERIKTMLESKNGNGNKV